MLGFVNLVNIFLVVIIHSCFIKETKESCESCVVILSRPNLMPYIYYTDAVQIYQKSFNKYVLLKTIIFNSVELFYVTPTA